MVKKFFSVTAITSRIQTILQPTVGKEFWIKAEISSGRERGGAFYCDLVESDKAGNVIAQLRAQIWIQDLSKIRKKFKELDLDLKLENGSVAGFCCTLQYNPKFGLSLQVIDADPAFAIGEMALKKNSILKTLKKEGLFENQKQLNIPLLPQKIGLITSVGSAAYNDFVKSLITSSYGFKIFNADSSVQGVQTENSIVHAITVLEKLGVDIIVIIRGGGSKTDLFWLDNEIIARRIALCSIPVWTGIGHEVDISVLDYVANQKFKTPTAVAETILFYFSEMEAFLEQSKQRLKTTWLYRFEIDKKKITQYSERLLKETHQFLSNLKQALRYKTKEIESLVNARLVKEKTLAETAMISLRNKPFSLIELRLEIIDDIKNRLNNESLKKINDSFDELVKIKKRFSLGRYLAIIDKEMKQINDIKSNLFYVFNSELNSIKQNFMLTISSFSTDKILSRIKNETAFLKSSKQILKSMDPATNLSRGFSLIYSENGNLIKSIKDISVKKIIKTELSDGYIISTTEKIEGKNYE